MIRTKEELIDAINSLLPEGAEDLSILEDFSDTYDDLTRAPDPYEQRYNELLKKYRDRFVTVRTETEPEETEPEETESLTYEDLFDETEKKYM